METQCSSGKYAMSHMHILPGGAYLSHRQPEVQPIYIPRKQLKATNFSFDAVFAEVGVKEVSCRY